MHAMETLDIAPTLAITMPGGSELLLILLIIVVVFGHNKIPQLGEALGKGIKNFRKSFAKDETEVEAAHVDVQELPKAEPSSVQKVKDAEDSKVT